MKSTILTFLAILAIFNIANAQNKHNITQMKKVIFIGIICILPLVGFGQKTITKLNDSSTQMNIETDDGVYCFMDRGDYYTVIDAKNNQFSKNELDHDFQYRFLGSFENETEIISIYHHMNYDKKAEDKTKRYTENFYMNKISKKDNIPTWNPLLLYTFYQSEKLPCISDINYLSVEKGFVYFAKSKQPAYERNFCSNTFHLAVSPDKSKFLIVFNYLTNVHYTFAGSMLYDQKLIQLLTFKSNGEKLWEKEVDLDLGKVEFDKDRSYNKGVTTPTDYILDNNGTTFIASIRREYIQSSEHVINYSKYTSSFIICSISDNSTNIFTKTINEQIFVRNLRLESNKDKKIILYGFYAPNVNYAEKGIFTLTFDHTTKSFSDLFTKELEIDKYKIGPFNESWIRPYELYEFSNGKIAIIGHAFQNYNNSYIRNNYWTIIQFINQNGSFDKEKYYLVKEGDEEYPQTFFYNDNLFVFWRHFDPNIKSKTISSRIKNVFSKINNNGDAIEKDKTLIDYDEAIKIRNAIFLSKDGLIFVNYDYIYYKINCVNF